MLPADLIFIRHGESEGNIAIHAALQNDNRFFTSEFMARHSRNFRLTDRGIEQAKIAGEWLRKNVPQPLDRFYVSDYIRAKETAGYLGLPQALWCEEFHLRERDKALMDNLPEDEQRRLYLREYEQYKLDPFLSYPAGGGESIATLCFRLRASMLDRWSRRWSDRRMAGVCHGHVMRGFQLELEELSHDDFLRLEASDDPEDKIRNCQIFWYTRRDPDTGQLTDHLVARRSVCPWDPHGDYGWKRIIRRKLSNEDLLEEVARYPRHANSLVGA